MSKGIGGHHSARMKNHEWITPKPLFNTLGTFDLDPCSPIVRPWDTALHHYNKNDDGLKQPWFGRVWLNAPYDNLEAWLQLLVEHGNGISLQYARTETQWFFKYGWRAASSRFFMEGRPHFCYVDGTPAKANSGGPVCYFSYGEENVEALEKSGLPGYHERPKTDVFIIGVSEMESADSWLQVVKLSIARTGEINESDLTPIYEMVQRIAPTKVSNNQFWKEKIRQKLQVIRKVSPKQTELFN